MYSDAFCKVYNQFGWNYFPEAFGEQLITWLHQYQITVRKSLDLPAARRALRDSGGRWYRGQRNGFFGGYDRDREAAKSGDFL